MDVTASLTTAGPVTDPSFRWASSAGVQQADIWFSAEGMSSIQ